MKILCAIKKRRTNWWKYFEERKCHQSRTDWRTKIKNYKHCSASGRLSNHSQFSSWSILRGAFLLSSFVLSTLFSFWIVHCQKFCTSWQRIRIHQESWVSNMLTAKLYVSMYAKLFIETKLWQIKILIQQTRIFK